MFGNGEVFDEVSGYGGGFRGEGGYVVEGSESWCFDYGGAVDDAGFDCGTEESGE